jgi:hypothetical protein
MRYQRSFPALLLAGLLFLTTELVAGGNSFYCRKTFAPPEFDSGEYEFIIVGANSVTRVRDHVRDEVSDIIRRQEVMFFNTRFAFKEGRLPSGARSAATKVDSLSMRRAYIVVDDVGIQDLSKSVGGGDVLVVIPSFDRPDVVAELKKHPLRQAEYLERMSLHATLQAMSYWHRDHNVRETEITFEHMMTNPEN